MTATLRKARHDDVPAMVAVENASFSQPNWVGQDFLKYPCTVAEVEGKVVGYLVFREVAPRTRRSPAEREILNLAIAPRSRHRGVATLLLNHALASGSVYFLEVRESNVAAQTLYRKLGFREVGRRPEYYVDPPENAIVMRVN